MKILIIVFLSSIIIFSCTKIPDKPNNIPQNSFYDGNWKTGGYWIEFVEATNDSTLRYRIYLPNSGEIFLDADFTLESKCRKYFSSGEEIANSYKYFGGSYIRVSSVKDNIDCDLNITKEYKSQSSHD